MKLILKMGKNAFYLYIYILNKLDSYKILALKQHFKTTNSKHKLSKRISEISKFALREKEYS